MSDYMNDDNFRKLKQGFRDAKVGDKIRIYTSAEDLSVDQYKELLSTMTANELQILERGIE